MGGLCMQEATQKKKRVLIMARFMARCPDSRCENVSRQQGFHSFEAMTSRTATRYAMQL